MAKQNLDSPFLNWPVCISSENNFPTAAGLASSAAGYACLVSALGSLYKVQDDLSVVARLGSGSACRSVYGGFVQWEKGTLTDGSDSKARQVAPENHWPDLRIFILVVNAGRKKKGSSVGMKESVQTSDLIHHRANVVVPKRMKEITCAILARDFQKFGEITMKDSNQFHAVCLDTYPPIHYLDSISFDIIDFVHAYNDYYGEIKLAYTFDAGPNGCLFLQEKDAPEIMAFVRRLFPSSSNGPEYIRGIKIPDFNLSQEMTQSLDLPVKPDALKYIISTKVGAGPQVITETNQEMLKQVEFILQS